jgi:hypothetical protein
MNQRLRRATCLVCTQFFHDKFLGVNYIPEEPSTDINCSEWEAHGKGTACPLHRPWNLTSKNIPHSNGNVVMHCLAGRPHFCEDFTRYFVGSESFLECLGKEYQRWLYKETESARDVCATFSTNHIIGTIPPRIMWTAHFPKSSVRLRW